jgi:hypothetical protein
VTSRPPALLAHPGPRGTVALVLILLTLAFVLGVTL